MNCQPHCQSIQNTSSHIFLVDDDDSMRLTLSAMLRSWGYQVHTYSSALELLQQPFDVMPAVIITDVLMPGMTGMELQAELLKRSRQIPIIFMSGRGNIPEAVQAIKQGAIEFLVKPFDRDQLLGAVIRGLERDALNTYK